MNYVELVDNIKSYVQDYGPDFSAAIPSFVEQAERRIYNSVQLLDLRSNATGTCTANNKYLTVPADWLANFSLACIDPTTGAYEYLLNKDVNFIRQAYPRPTDTGKPKYYAMFDQNSYILGPTPDQAYTMELHYFFYPQSIVTANNTWLSINFPFVLLYGCLLEAYTFMKGEADVMATYQARYDEAMSMLKQYAEGKNRQDMYRTQQVRYPVK
jgi:hypothetical protein